MKKTFKTTIVALSLILNCGVAVASTDNNPTTNEKLNDATLVGSPTAEYLGEVLINSPTAEFLEEVKKEYGKNFRELQIEKLKATFPAQPNTDGLLKCNIQDIKLESDALQFTGFYPINEGENRFNAASFITLKQPNISFFIVDLLDGYMTNEQLLVVQKYVKDKVNKCNEQNAEKQIKLLKRNFE